MSQLKVIAEVTGKVWKIQMSEGAQVSEDDSIMVVESMKMEIPIESPSAGTVREVLVAEGEAVQDGQWLVTLD